MESHSKPATNLSIIKDFWKNGHVTNQVSCYHNISLMSRNACDCENSEKSPEGWRFKLDAKSDPEESGDNGANSDFSEIGDLGENG